MPKPENIIGKGFDKHPENINKSGRPIGARNRSTIARSILESTYNTPQEIKSELEAKFPDLPKKLTVEEIITVMQINKAITEQDTAAYKAVMDSGWGAPTQQIDMNDDRLTEIKIYEIKKGE